MKIIVPTYKPINREQETHIKAKSKGEYDLVFTCQLGKSAAHNRNFGLAAANEGEPVIMLDDDITDLPENWNNELVQILQGPVVMVSARLMKRGKRKVAMLWGSRGIVQGHYEVSPIDELASACIAFIHTGIYFDEKYIGSGVEDIDFCRTLRESKIGPSLFLIDNHVRVIHKHEAKEQTSNNWEYNRKYYKSKWGEQIRGM